VCVCVCVWVCVCVCVCVCACVCVCVCECVRVCITHTPTHTNTHIYTHPLSSPLPLSTSWFIEYWRQMCATIVAPHSLNFGFALYCSHASFELFWSWNFGARLMNCGAIFLILAVHHMEAMRRLNVCDIFFWLYVWHDSGIPRVACLSQDMWDVTHSFRGWRDSFVMYVTWLIHSVCDVTPSLYVWHDAFILCVTWLILYVLTHSLCMWHD